MDLKTFITDQLLSGQQIEADDDLLLSGLVDSMGVMRLVAYIEKSMGFRVPPRDLTLENFQTVNAISAYVEGKRAS